MKIISSNIQLDSQRAYIKSSETTTRLRAFAGNEEINIEERTGSLRLEGSAERSQGRFESSTSPLLARRPGLGLGAPTDLIPSQGRPLLETARNNLEAPDELEVGTGSKLDLTRKILEAMFNKEIKILKFEYRRGGDGETYAPPEGQASGTAGGQAGAEPPRGFGLEYDRTTTNYEAEKTNFSAKGVVKTVDGRQIDFNLALEMSRERLETESVSLRLGEALKDPLVLNFSGGAAELSDARFEFDLDADGESDSVNFLSSDSGFLAFDRNKDGTINDGSELFGPSTGDGFSELAAYDEDGNNFIDEGDSIYNSLGIYNKNSDGEDILTSLSESGVGAIYLDRATTEFSLNDANNEQLGQVRTSSVFIGEEGSVGTVQQVDLSTAASGSEEPVPQEEPVQQLDISA